MAEVRTLSSSPRLGPLYRRAVLRRGGRGGELPDTELVLPDLQVDREHLAAYDRVCGYPLDDRLPVTYPHVLGFPLQVQLMTDRAFPLALTGLVHVRNQITQHRPVRLDETLRVRVHAERFVAHPRGAQVDLVAAVDVAGEPVWHGRSTYLAKGAKAPDGSGEAPSASGSGSGSGDDPRPSLGERPAAVWRVGRDAGRRYARVSGDVNPIHLTPLAARAFGFPGAIAHGMWAKARCLAALQGRLPEVCTVDVVFRKPLLLGSTVHLLTRAVGEGWDLGLRSARGGATYLLGTVRPRA